MEKNKNHIEQKSTAITQLKKLPNINTSIPTLSNNVKENYGKTGMKISRNPTVRVNQSILTQKNNGSDGMGRRGLNQISFEAIKIIKKFKKYSSLHMLDSDKKELQNSQIQNKNSEREVDKSRRKKDKLRGVYDGLLRIINQMFIQNLGPEIAPQLSNILNRLVFAYQVDVNDICSQFSHSQNNPTHRHTHNQPQLRILAYQCLKDKYQQVLKIKQQISKQITTINQQMQEFSDSLSQSIYKHQLQAIITKNNLKYLQSKEKKQKHKQVAMETKSKREYYQSEFQISQSNQMRNQNNGRKHSDLSVKS